MLDLNGRDVEEEQKGQTPAVGQSELSAQGGSPKLGTATSPGPAYAQPSVFCSYLLTDCCSYCLCVCISEGSLSGVDLA